MAGDALNFIEIFSSEDDRSPLKPSSIVKTEKDEKNMEDLDCIILDFDPFEDIDLSKKLSIEDKPSTEDLSVIFERGLVACRDYPHSRHLCAKFPFDKTPHESYCEQCYCYVCDAPAPCKDWKGIEQEHCHASEHYQKWKLLRTERKNLAAPTVPRWPSF
eukprot:TRINITY_DN5361_c0_g3_i2.p1 TRINITY_DN5361_c0_g3~~TRINITY_DN5361_c0_g3_i2.p1  ORF type:complete len:176 (+),score=23.52 TRINITY_DN5361_c0_g3_i2:50-529(+)